MPLKTLVREALRLSAARSCVRLGGLCLPPARLRRQPLEPRDDELYLESARNEARRLVERCDLDGASRVLDIGCGAGRLALGIRSVLGSVRRYEGIDGDGDAVAWCRRWITREHPELRFTHLDVDGDCRLEHDEGVFGVIYLGCMLPRLEDGSVPGFPGFRGFLGEMRRVLAPGGRIFLSAHLEEEPFVRLLADIGLVVLGLDRHAEHDGRSGVYLAHGIPGGR